MSTAIDNVASTGKNMVEELAAAMHSHGGFFSRTRQTDLRFLLRKSQQPIGRVIQQICRQLEFDGSVDVNPKKSMSTGALLSVLANIILVHAIVGIRYFCQQLDKAGDLDTLLVFQPEQHGKLQRCAEARANALSLEEAHPGLLKREHLAELDYVVKTLVHRAPGFAASLNIRGAE